MALNDIFIRPSTPEDASFVVAAFDAALPWLEARGSVQQWGTKPFSERPDFVKLVHDYAASQDWENGRTFIAECPASLDTANSNGTAGPLRKVPAAAIVLSHAHPEYASPPPDGLLEIFVRILVSDVRLPRSRAGSELIRFAVEQAKGMGIKLLRVDCWRGGQGRLVRWYEKQGFKRCRDGNGEFEVVGKHEDGKKWEGIVLEMWLD